MDSKESEEKKMVAEDLATLYDDPYKFVKYAFPWKKAGTQLQDYDGPRKWQRDYLRTLSKEIKDRKFNGKDPVKPIQIAVASGHGPGKSCLSAWLILFIHWSRPFSKGSVTSNTSEQLKTKTWSEVGKWYNLSHLKFLSTYNSSKGNMNLFNIEHPQSWRVDAITCREENSESFAGQHTSNSTPFYLFDEASAISNKIFEVAQGGMTDGEPMFFVFGNPTRNTGFFKDCFASKKHRWITKQIDSRTVEGTNKELFKEWIKDNGIGSDFVKVRVLGQFPSSSVCQYIPSDIVDKAIGKHLNLDQYNFAPVILGVDVSYFGDDKSVIFLRQGLMSKLLGSWRDISTIQLADLVARFEDEYEADATFIDVTGVGAGVVDRLQSLGREPLKIYFAGGSSREQYKNKRAECWGNMKDWLKTGGVLPANKELAEELISPEYYYSIDGKILLEKKADMKKRGIASPDCFIAGTKITTSKGQKNIEDIKTGELIFTPLGYSKVIKKHSNIVKETYKNKHFTSTANHKIVTNNGVKTMQKLKQEDIISSYNYKQFFKWNLLWTTSRFITERNIGNLKQLITIMPIVSILEKEKKLHYIEKFGKIIANLLFLIIIAFIILTATLKTINILILNVWLSFYMLRNTCLKCLKIKIIEKETGSNSLICKKKLLNGIKTNSSNLSEKRQEENLGYIVKKVKTYVLGVMKYILHIILQGANIVLTIVNKNNGLKNKVQRYINTKDNVYYVTKNLHQEESKNIVLIPVVQKGSVEVFNLTLKNHNVYYANKCLVFNCSDALALTFSGAVVKKSTDPYDNRKPLTVETEYDLF